MSRDAIWQAFAETGDPLYYLLYKSMNGQQEKQQQKKKDRKDDGAGGQMPRATD